MLAPLFRRPSRARRRQPGQADRKTRFATVVGKLSGVNALIFLLAFVTSPILTRTLGPSGRGDLAAITVVLVLAPTIADGGLCTYVTREAARRVRSLGSILGSVVPVALAVSMVGVVLAVPIAHVLGRGRREVVFFIEIGLVTLPLVVFLQTLCGVAIGRESWGRVMLSRFVSFGGAALVIVALWLTDALTVATAAGVYLVTGVGALLPYLRGLRGSKPWRFRAHIAREGLAFGCRTWLWAVATQGNASLDQVMMAVMVSSRQLGLYALAVSVAGVSNALIGAVMNAVQPRVAGGDTALAARTCRMTILLVGSYGIVVGLSSPVAVPLVLGSAFSDSVPMLLVLLAANVFLSAGLVLSSALIAAGDPGASARSQLVGLLITVPGLICAVPLAGGLGAASVSAASYAASFLVVLVAALSRFEATPRAFLLVTSSDLRWLRTWFGRRGASMVTAASSA